MTDPIYRILKENVYYRTYIGSTTLPTAGTAPFVYNANQKDFSIFYIDETTGDQYALKKKADGTADVWSSKWTHTP